MLLCLMSDLVSSLVPCLVSYLIYGSINIQVLLLLHRDRETRVPAYEH